LVYIYGKSIKRKKLKYFLQYKRQVILLKSKNSLLNNKKKVHQRLFNDLKNKEDIKDVLYQKYLLEESKKYTYFPSINRYNLILEKYYLIKDIPNVSYNTERIKKYKSKLEPNTLTSNMKKIPYQARLSERTKLINMNKSFSAINKSKSINFFPQKNVNVNLQNSTFKNSFFKSISKEKLSPILPESIKTTHKKSMKILQLKNTIPHNFKKKMVKTEANHKAQKSFFKSKMSKDNQNSLNNNIMNKTNFSISKETNNSVTNKRSNSYQNTEILSEEKSTNIHSKKNTISLKNISLNENNNNKYFFNNKIVHNMDSTIFDSNRKSNSYMNLLNVNKDRSNHLISIKYRPSNNLLGADNNSLSTNFIDRNSQIDNYNSILKENNQHSFFYYKFNRNTSYIFSKEKKNINIDGVDSENIDDKTDIKDNNSINNKRSDNDKLHFINQISSIKKCESNKIEKNNLDEIFKKISIHCEDNKNDNRIQKNERISNINTTKIDLNNIENEADFNIMSERNEDKNEILAHYKISSNVVNENVNNNINEDNDIRMSISEKSEPTTIQSMDDSKILEMANQLLNQEDTVDRIKIYDILSSKKNKI
jgi:hypothetical protein